MLGLKLYCCLLEILNTFQTRGQHFCVLLGPPSYLLNPAYWSGFSSFDSAVWKKLSFHHFMVFQAREVFIADKQSRRADRASSHLAASTSAGQERDPLFLILKEHGPEGSWWSAWLPQQPFRNKLCEVGSLQLRDPLPQGQACMSPERWGRGAAGRGQVQALVMGRAASRHRRSQAWTPRRGQAASSQKPEASASGCPELF